MSAGAPAGALSEWREVVPAEWLPSTRELVESGFTYLDVITAVDRGPQREVFAVLLNPTTHELLGLRSDVPESGVIASISELFPAAVWHERETSEMFGITFESLIDARPLLRREMLGNPPLLKSVVLAARVAREWPGAAEPEVRDDGRKAGNPSKRRQLPAGVPAQWWEQP